MLPFQTPPLKIPDNTEDLLPASVRDDYAGRIELRSPAEADIRQVLRKELDIRKLKLSSRWFWLMGRQTPTRPLHWQRCQGRDVLPIEEMGMHLVWTTGRIFIKPVPRFLLAPTIWKGHLSCTDHCRKCSDKGHSRATDEQTGAYCLRATALGFLISYTTLIMYESDFNIAKDMQLVPAELSWSSWRRFVKELLDQHSYGKVEERFRYGELRLDRLNQAWRLTHFPFTKSYQPSYDRYTTFLQAWFAVIAAVTVYIVVALTGLQVGLATERLGANDTYQAVAYGFSVFSLMGPLVVTGVLLTCFLITFLGNWIGTIAFQKKREHSLGGSSESGNAWT